MRSRSQMLHWSHRLQIVRCPTSPDAARCTIRLALQEDRRILLRRSKIHVKGQTPPRRRRQNALWPVLGRHHLVRVVPRRGSPKMTEQSMVSAYGESLGSEPMEPIIRRVHLVCWTLATTKRREPRRLDREESVFRRVLFGCAWLKSSHFQSCQVLAADV